MTGNAPHDSGDVDPRLTGRTVSRCYLDFAFGIEFFEDGPLVDVRVEGAFTVSDATGTWTVDPGHRTNIERALTVLHRRVSRAVARGDGTLEIELSGGLSVRVAPNPPYEAWTLATSDGAKLVCLPSGRLAVWGRW